VPFPYLERLRVICILKEEKSIEQVDVFLTRIRFWGRFVGVMTVILGLLTAYQGLTTSLIGVIPGVISIMGGYFLYRTAMDASRLVKNQGNEMSNIRQLLEHYGYFLQVTGTLFTLAIILYLYFWISK